MKLAAHGRGAAYFGAMLGAAVSIAANVAHSYIPPAGAPADWSPKGGAVAMSIFWPVALAIVVEIAARTVWPRGGWYVLLRAVCLTPVAGVAAVVSYRHMSGLLAFYGEDPITVKTGPIAVDGLMLLSTVAIILAGRAVPSAAELVVASPPTAVPVIAPRPILDVVPAGVRLLPIVGPLRNSQTSADDVPAPPPTPDAQDSSENFSTGSLHILPPPSAGRPAAETRRLYEALLAEAHAQGQKLTQVAAAEKLGISRRTLRDALAATAEPAEAHA